MKGGWKGTPISDDGTLESITLAMKFEKRGVKTLRPNTLHYNENNCCLLSSETSPDQHSQLLNESVGS